MAYQVVARIHTEHHVYEATRVYYPQHPANAVEFDDATTGNRTLLFGPCRVEHLAVDNLPKVPFFSGQIYYLFWLGWLGVCIAGLIVVARILRGP